MKRILLLYLFLTFHCYVIPQNYIDKNDSPAKEVGYFSHHEDVNRIESYASEWFDVTFYSLNIRVATDPQLLKGSVTIKGLFRESGKTSLTFDLINTMKIDSIILEGERVSFIQDTASFTIQLKVASAINDEIKVDIYYWGLPVPTGFGSFRFSTYGMYPWIWSLSQPYGARDWFPCKDYPGDKADSVDIIITCDSALTVGSNGRLMSIQNNYDGTRTYYWQERYPIATYLISVAIGRYESFSQWWKFNDSDSMEVIHYVLPPNLESAYANLSKTIEMLEIFSDMFGQYPFVKEKYGHIDIGSGGAMEHQTLTSTTTYAENVIAHELAHQWFGDMITCRNWRDIWLNEGFAQYATALYLERKYGKEAYWIYIWDQLGDAKQAQGSIYINDTSVVRNIFDWNLVYAKGASILHMLRHVLGDTVFFKVLYSYVNDPEFTYKTATINDFRSVCENVSGKSLDYFFNQWIYGIGYPHYKLTWKEEREGNNNLVSVTIEQKSDNDVPNLFIMPIDITIRGISHDTTIQIFNDSIKQSFSFFIPFTVKSVELDREGWILKDVEEQIAQNYYYLYQICPNTFNRRSLIQFQIPRRLHVLIEIYNILGQKISTLIDGTLIMGRHSIEFDGSNLPSGVYLYRLSTPESSFIKKMLILR